MMAKPLQPLGDVVGGAAKLSGISMVCLYAGGRFAGCWRWGNQGYNGPDTLSKVLMNAVSEDCFVGSYLVSAVLGVLIFEFWLSSIAGQDSRPALATASVDAFMYKVYYSISESMPNRRRSGFLNGWAVSCFEMIEIKASKNLANCCLTLNPPFQAFA